MQFEKDGVKYFVSDKKRLNKVEHLANRKFYNVRSLFGIEWAMFYVILGARECGKSYSVMDRFVKDWKVHGRPFTWLRLTESSTKKLLSNNADKFVDPDLVRKYGLKLTVKGNQVFDDGKKMAKVLALSTFYNDKGVALYDNEYDLGYNICLDEMNKEKSEKRTFDIGYAFVNQMENLVRSTKEKIRIVLVGNTLEEASDIMCLFNFIPEEFGRYKLRSKKCVVDYVENSRAYIERRKGTVSDVLTPTESTFTNVIDVDRTLVYKGNLKKPTYVIMFNKKDIFTVWDDKVIKKYNKEKLPASSWIPMRPYLEWVFSTERRDAVMQIFHNRMFRFKDLITQKEFKKNLEILKPSK